ncbi:putative sucrose transport protein [Corynespora cassiicola Philippines]|uniref:Putative sucrose transport protein n=1 Tax=Corynespora cassiicola Philippines TaxID=1448308 RepID=A0A2T2NGP6_CORCC|nr:putative sucrose transport protein [Corynespora cassiicola Philippines]
MAPLALIEQPKRENRKLPTHSLMAMTCGVGGLQVLWSTIFSHGSSYLFSLGISKTQSSLIWAVAPICGSIVQPILGVISDRSRISWGRRRPFILGGVVTTVLAALILAWAGPISTAFCILFDIRDIDGTRAAVTQFTAILSVILLNISIQPLQLGLRSLNIDVCPREQQSIASAWASRFAGIGNIFGYVLGSLPLPWISSDYEAIRFRYMVQCTIVALIVTSFISCYYTEEENPKLSEYDPEVERPVYRIFQYMIEGFSKTSQRVRRVYLIQFFSWFGWFGFLFYSTSCISQLYVEEQAKNNVTISSTLKDHGMRVGAMANLMFAIVALATNIVLPRLSTSAKSMTSRTKNHDWETCHIFSQLPFIWGFGQLVYVICVLSMVMVSSSTTGTFMVAIAGLSWGITQWVPFAIIGEEAARHQINDGSIQREDGGVWSVVQGGRIMGMHNAAISIPQIIAALFSSAIFWIAQKLGRENAIVWVIGWSGLPGAIAAWLAFIM